MGKKMKLYFYKTYTLLVRVSYTLSYIIILGKYQ